MKLVADDPPVLERECAVLDRREGAILLDGSPFYPGGGGQLPDRGTIRGNDAAVTVTGFAPAEGGPTGAFWHLLTEDTAHGDRVVATVDEPFRSLMCEEHTVAHVVNAVVYQHFDGALLTGVGMKPDATFWLDFDLAGVERDAMRALAEPINQVLARDLSVWTDRMDYDAAEAEAGLFRAKGAKPPRSDDGTVRVVGIGDFDRQACGGTHLSSTGQARSVRISKVDNKGRQNRRIRFAFVDV